MMIVPDLQMCASNSSVAQRGDRKRLCQRTKLLFTARNATRAGSEEGRLFSQAIVHSFYDRFLLKLFPFGDQPLSSSTEYLMVSEF